jgi:hypothetical protein
MQVICLNPKAALINRLRLASLVLFAEEFGIPAESEMGDSLRRRVESG